jgi:hypothetical protein
MGILMDIVMFVPPGGFNPKLGRPNAKIVRRANTKTGLTSNIVKSVSLDNLR